MCGEFANITHRCAIYWGWFAAFQKEVKRHIMNYILESISSEMRTFLTSRK